MARIEAKMQALGMFEKCTGCDKDFNRGDTMNAVVSDNGKPLGWHCDECVESWRENSDKHNSCTSLNTGLCTQGLDKLSDR